MGTWGGGALAGQARLGEDTADVRLGWRRRDGLDRLRDALCEHPAGLPCLAPRRGIAGQVASSLVDGRCGAPPNRRDGVRHVVDPWQPRAGIAGLAHRDKAKMPPQAGAARIPGVLPPGAGP